jgi:hypothetical protein
LRRRLSQVAHTWTCCSSTPFLSWNTYSQISFFQQDLSLDVRRALNATFPGRWIGRDGPTDWPPRSPDITPFSIFLWGYVKDRIYATKVRDFRDLRAWIVETVGSMTPDVLQRTWAELDCRLNILRVTSGAHVEVY